MIFSGGPKKRWEKPQKKATTGVHTSAALVRGRAADLSILWHSRRVATVVLREARGGSQETRTQSGLSF